MGAPLEGKEMGIAGDDIKLGSIGESIVSGGFKRKLRLLFEETVFGEGIARGPCSLLGDIDPKGWSKWLLFVAIDWAIILTSGGAYSAAADRASRP